MDKKNKMKKIIMLLMLLVSLASVNAKCDWSSLKLQQWNERNYYKWYVSGKVLDDTCVDWMFLIYDFQTKKTDTLNDNRGLVEVSFNKKGKYKMYLKVWNKCEKCDTTLYREVNIVQFPGATVSSTPSVSDCKKYKFEMSYINGFSVKDTCMSYYLVEHHIKQFSKYLGLDLPTINFAVYDSDNKLIIYWD